MGTVFRDLSYAIRLLLRSPIFTSVAVLSLALGIGANVTIFTFVNAVLLEPLPVKEPSRLVSVYGAEDRQGVSVNNFLPVSYLNYVDFRDNNEVFSGLTAYAAAELNWMGTGEPEELNGLIVTGNYFDVLGVAPIIGRTFLPEEDETPGRNPVIILSHKMWQNRMGSDPSILGKTLMLNATPFTVIGVAPKDFKGTSVVGSPDFWVPMMMNNVVLTGRARQYFNERRALLFYVIGRLKEGLTIQQAQDAMKGLAKQLEQEYPIANEKRTVALISLLESNINPNQRSLFTRAGVLLMIIVALVLLIACANLANLMLAKALRRRKEIAIRLALGAGRGRLLRQLLTESLLLSLIGGIAGLFVARWCREILWAYRPPFFANNSIDLSMNSDVLTFTILVSLLTGLVFGLAPAVQGSRPDLIVELKEKSSQPNQFNRRFSLRNVLVISQVALSLVSLIGAGLFVKSLRNAQQTDPGFETEKLMVVSFNLAAQGYDESKGQEFYRQVQQRVEALPGVESASLASNVPLAGGWSRTVFFEGQASDSASKGVLILTNIVGLKYFDTVGIPLVKGRDFNEGDKAGAPRVALINESMARRYWQDQDPIGKRFKFFGDESFIEVSGVVKDSKLTSLSEDGRACVYLPLLQNYAVAPTLHVRTSIDPRGVMEAAQKAVRSLDSNLPLLNPSVISEVIDRTLWAQRMGAMLLAIFGILALVLAAVGIYGVLAYTVSQRSREIGIRMALGAQRADIMSLVLRQAMFVVMFGVCIGLILGFILTRFISSLLFGVSSIDPVTFVVAPLVLLIASLVASYMPARRATRVSPLEALRYE